MTERVWIVLIIVAGIGLTIGTAIDSYNRRMSECPKEQTK